MSWDCHLSGLPQTVDSCLKFSSETLFSLTLPTSPYSSPSLSPSGISLFFFFLSLFFLNNTAKPPQYLKRDHYDDALFTVSASSCQMLLLMLINSCSNKRGGGVFTFHHSKYKLLSKSYCGVQKFKLCFKGSDFLLIIVFCYCLTAAVLLLQLSFSLFNFLSLIHI